MILLKFTILSVEKTCALFPFSDVGWHRGKGIYLRKDGFFESAFVFLDEGEFVISGHHCYFCESDVVSVDCVAALFDVVNLESGRCMSICIRECR